MLNRLTDDSGQALIRVLIVGPDSLARASMESALSTADGLVVVGVAGLDDELQAVVDAFRPEVIVVEAAWDEIPPNHQLQILTELELPILLLSDQSSSLEALGDGWLAHSSSPAQIRAAIFAIAQGLVVFDKERYEAAESSQGNAGDLPIDPLTPRELEVLRLMAEGLTNRGIAFRLGISEYTVKFHVNAILTKLDAQSRTEAAVKAARLGLLLV
jgi:two-component system nitrate/nitrite response regulator NarL